MNRFVFSSSNFFPFPNTSGGILFLRCHPSHAAVEHGRWPMAGVIESVIDKSICPINLLLTLSGGDDVGDTTRRGN